LIKLFVWRKKARFSAITMVSTRPKESYYRSYFCVLFFETRRKTPKKLNSIFFNNLLENG